MLTPKSLLIALTKTPLSPVSLQVRAILLVDCFTLPETRSDRMGSFIINRSVSQGPDKVQITGNPDTQE